MQEVSGAKLIICIFLKKSTVSSSTSQYHVYQYGLCGRNIMFLLEGLLMAPLPAVQSPAMARSSDDFPVPDSPTTKRREDADDNDDDDDDDGDDD
jgi:hypothetical protein